MTEIANRTSTTRRLLVGAVLALSVGATGATAAPAQAATPVPTSAATTTTEGPVILARGARSDDVRAWQLNLRALLGTPIASDGIFGAQTEAATRAFQQRFHGPATGVVRQGDLRVLAFYLGGDEGAASDPRPPVDSAVRLSRGDRGEVVLKWQVDLMSVQTNVLVLDSAFGADTRAATIAFQRSQGIAADGVVGPDTRRAMQGALTAAP